MPADPTPSLTKEQFERVSALFAVAMERTGPLDERLAFVRREAKGDEAVFRQVEEMLSFHEADDPTTEEGFDAHAMAAVRRETFDMGDTLFEGVPEQVGPFRIVRHIATGGMGKVYEAEQEEPRRRVALKVIRSVFRTPRAVRRFETEANLLARMRHPNIAQIYAMGRADLGGTEAPYIVMEFVEGIPITEFIRRQRPTLRERLELITTVCDAVQYAHDAGVIHRDIKPSNILIEKDGTPKIVDFGIARTFGGKDGHKSSLSITGQVMGTLAYMSPEQARGGKTPLDVRTDVYSIGAVGYQLLVGNPPHELGEANVLEAYAVLSSRRAKRLSERDQRIDEDVTLIFDKALEADREERYASAREFGDDIRRYLAREPISVRPQTPTYQAARFIQRNRTSFGLAVLAFVALSVGLGFALRAKGVAQDAREQAESQSEVAERSLRAALLDAAATSIESYEGPHAARVLAELGGDPDTWEVQHLGARLRQASTVVPLDDAVPTQGPPVLLPDGARIVRRVGDRRLEIVDLDRGTATPWDLPEARPPVINIGLDASGSLLVTQHKDELTVYRLADRAQLKSITNGARRTVAPGGARHLYVWNFAEEAPGVSSHRLLDLESGGDVTACIPEEHVGRCWVLAAPGAIACETRSGVLRLCWLGKGGAPPVTLMRGTRVDRVFASHDGRWVAATEANRCRVWDAATGSVHWLVDGPAGDRAESLTFNEDGRRAAIVYRSGVVRLIDLAERMVVSSAFDERVRLDFYGGKPNMGGSWIDVRFLETTPPTLRTATVAAAARWAAGTARPPDVLTHADAPGLYPFVYNVAFHPRGRFLASAGWDMRVIIWDTWTGERVGILNVPAQSDGEAWTRPWELAWDDEGRHLGLYTQSGDTHILDVWCGELLPDDDGILKFPRFVEASSWKRRDWAGDRVAEVGQMVGTPDDRTRLAVRDREGAPIFELDGVRAYLGAALDAEGTRLFAGTRSGAVEVWDVDQQVRLLQLRGHADYVISLDLDPEDGTLATASGDGTVRLWATRSRESRVRRAVAAAADGAALRPQVAAVRAKAGDAQAAVAALLADSTLDPSRRDAALAELLKTIR